MAAAGRGIAVVSDDARYDLHGIASGRVERGSSRATVRRMGRQPLRGLGDHGTRRRPRRLCGGAVASPSCSRSDRVLIAGESWVTHSIHQKGFDSFTTTSYHEGVGPLRGALEAGGFSVDYLPSHVAARPFPGRLPRSAYAAVILSDIGANTLLLHPTRSSARAAARPLAAIRDYVAGGGGLVMVGGYLTFPGIEGRARWAGTPVERCCR